ncbi:transcriptional repressor p66-alpha isoform X2 [Sphaerodactylus townsendi]|nr:transcriptional repressor p66-alpha isoform X2 [Sphaerodactylus townsendi]XP_048351702.1 transcriptional repressor p66-alpha isoform X2 [Sphaerodactylus townsendi]XP_048351703.1 transcriptional repressor p66-alpha isoform X2 [Sphaerodactylus townsendi]XP_048351704.1 transcriptional repressor p66-alpha isoform X2 [Sphaerodactylus townsendi]XP_048351705.1 transcriptional repressor p66-alpha isoform X2 [Sphaerodactylus townsendi]
MTEESCRTRSQKRALEREINQNDVDSKKMKLDKGLLGVPEANTEGGDLQLKTDSATGRGPGLLKGAEMKATIKVEVQTGDEPVDMSTSKSDAKQERRVPSPDVIVLSDNEPSSPRMNGLTKIPIKETSAEVLMKSSPEERERMIKQLKEELRLEEAKLVLLKKLRQSQIQKEVTAQKPAGSSGNAVATPPPLVRGTQTLTSSKSSVLQNSSRISGTVIPPPLIRGGQQTSSKLSSQQNTQIVMPPLVRGAQQIHNIRQHSASGPPPLLLAPRASVPSVQIQGQRIIQQGLIRVASVPNASLLVNIPQASPTSLKGTAVTSAQANAAATATSVASIINSNDSPASRQAAAKLALRKQLEKTLLEIPPPKPPAPEMNFLPSAANNEFIYLVGLEEVVQNLLESQGKMSVAPSSQEPYTCVQCKTDFTCRWREEKRGMIMCETCMSSNQKRALKAEHTTRLKAAFVKALQQEQEIEQRILQQAASPGQTKPDPLTQQHHALKQTSGQLPRSASTPRGVLHAFSPSPKLQNASGVAVLGGRQGKRAQRPTGKGGACSWKKTLTDAGRWLALLLSPLAALPCSASNSKTNFWVHRVLLLALPVSFSLPSLPPSLPLCNVYFKHRMGPLRILAGRGVVVSLSISKRGEEGEEENLLLECEQHRIVAPSSRSATRILNGPSVQSCAGFLTSEFQQTGCNKSFPHHA